MVLTPLNCPKTACAGNYVIYYVRRAAAAAGPVGLDQKLFPKMMNGNDATTFGNKYYYGLNPPTFSLLTSTRLYVGLLVD